MFSGDRKNYLRLQLQFSLRSGYDALVYLYYYTVYCTRISTLIVAQGPVVFY
jgi:hypothetical protein